MIGQRIGTRTVVEVVSRTPTGRPRLVRVRCDCGCEEQGRLMDMRRSPCRCTRLGPLVRRRRTAARWLAMAATGGRIGRRTVIAYLGWIDGQHWIRVRCDCGAELDGLGKNIAGTTGCRVCASSPPSGTRSRDYERATRYAGLLAEAGERAPEVWRSCDPASVDAVIDLAELLGPLTLEEVGALLGVSRERARQLEAKALGHARRAARHLREHAEGRACATWQAWDVAAEAAVEGW